MEEDKTFSLYSLLCLANNPLFRMEKVSTSTFIINVLWLKVAKPFAEQVLSCHLTTIQNHFLL
ncbi:MAG TPA: hypothetical protein VNR61_19315, partial [Niallia sp.]|nr:hypothetical protein [Niallia sp.]